MAPDDHRCRALDLLSRTAYGRVSASQRALPFTTVTRHLVVDGRLLLRLHRGHGYHPALDGSVVAYEADNVHEAGADTWSVQCTGTARLADPGPAELARFGPAPRLADGEPYDAVHLSVEPLLVKVHRLHDAPVFRYAHSV
ncbi:pyridoxamine 5'-phosphate oxidase family protein [Streptomyces sp. NPDC003077]|uniref:pyridoxamine 5'-phosphate oxidase family protein n=1 Tax=Streptomyces sp. NPDC003077 TaxID=3154443 RepID=UPI0033B81433